MDEVAGLAIIEQLVAQLSFFIFLGRRKLTGIQVIAIEYFAPKFTTVRILFSYQLP
jgi:hypothetical protein